METLEYKVTKRMVQTGNYIREDMIENIGLFKICNRITSDQYLELMELINPKPPVQPQPIEPVADEVPKETTPNVQA